MPVLDVLGGLEGELDEQRRPGGVTGHRPRQCGGISLGRRALPGRVAETPRAIEQLDGGRPLETEEQQVRREAEQCCRERGVELGDPLRLVDDHRVPRLDIPCRHPQPAEEEDELRAQQPVFDQVRRLLGEGLAPDEAPRRVHRPRGPQEPCSPLGVGCRQGR